MHSLKLAHTFTHKKSPICSQSHTCTFPQIQHNHKEHHTHMLTDELLILTMKFTHLHTHTDALVYLHAHACTLTHRSILHFHVLSHAFTQTHMNILTFMPMVTNAPIHKKSPIHFPPANSYLNRHPQSLSHVLIHMHMVRFTCSKYSHIHLLKKLLTHLLECTGN